MINIASASVSYWREPSEDSHFVVRSTHAGPNSVGNITLSPAIDLRNMYSHAPWLRCFSIRSRKRHLVQLEAQITIDRHGNIKNCPSRPEQYGNIENISLAETLNDPVFKKWWYIHKDEIEVCRDCEFRYNCTDCRAFLKDSDDIYSKPLKCGYNPYSNVWEDWSTNTLKAKKIVNLT